MCQCSVRLYSWVGDRALTLLSSWLCVMRGVQIQASDGLVQFRFRVGVWTFMLHVFVFRCECTRWAFARSRQLTQRQNDRSVTAVTIQRKKPDRSDRTLIYVFIKCIQRLHKAHYTWGTAHIKTTSRDATHAWLIQRLKWPIFEHKQDCPPLTGSIIIAQMRSSVFRFAACMSLSHWSNTKKSYNTIEHCQTSPYLITWPSAWSNNAYRTLVYLGESTQGPTIALLSNGRRKR